ncbi:MAG: hypothetical protein E6Q95_02235 [Chitinophagaceae bacterium]|nr:MAG: hypothetical protein E6Q95_02235 [Chitinophagaceae bacterium]
MNFITLITDIGKQNHLIGVVKAQLLQAVHDSHIIDISHNIAPFDFPQASYISRGTFNNFPEFSFHIIIVNFFDKQHDHFLLVFYKNQYILCADNGLIGMLLDEKPEMVLSIPFEKNAAHNLLTCTKVMATTIKKIVDGIPIQKIGIPDLSFNYINPLQPNINQNNIETQILYIDSFENVVVNITKDQFEKHRNGRKFKILFTRNEMIETISNTYADVQEGQKLAFFNSLGYLEIAINKGNAAGLFGLSGYSYNKQISNTYSQNKLFYQMVRIQFD